jgi:topoisomerase-4 subunit B
MRTKQVMLTSEDHIQKMLEYYMGKNSQQRQEFIIANLKIEIDKE